MDAKKGIVTMARNRAAQFKGGTEPLDTPNEAVFVAWTVKPKPTKAEAVENNENAKVDADE